MKSIAEQSLAELTEAIASQAPAPGSGVAAAAALALGLACARKAAAITLKHHPEREGLERSSTHLALLAEEALRLGDQDAACFPAAFRNDVGAAAKLTQGDRRLIDVAKEARTLVERMAAETDPMMRNDILAAQSLIDAAATIVRANLRENRDQSPGSSRSDADR